MTVTIEDLPFEVISIKFIDGEHLTIYGRYRRDLQTDNWHYYEEKSGRLIHIAKGTIKYIDGGTVDSLRLDKKINKLWKQNNSGGAKVTYAEECQNRKLPSA